MAVREFKTEKGVFRSCEIHAEVVEILNSPEGDFPIIESAIHNLASRVAKNEDTSVAERVIRRAILHHITYKEWNVLAEKTVTAMKEVEETFGKDVAAVVSGRVYRLIYDSIADFIFVALGIVESGL